MGFLNELVSEFTHSGQHSQHGQQQGPPPVSPPWYAEWDTRDSRWLFVNQQTGERTFTYPGAGNPQQQTGYTQAQGEHHGGNGWKYAAAGAAGLVGGGVLMHEGHEMSMTILKIFINQPSLTPLIQRMTLKPTNITSSNVPINSATRFKICRLMLQAGSANRLAALRIG